MTSVTIHESVTPWQWNVQSIFQYWKKNNKSYRRRYIPVTSDDCLGNNHANHKITFLLLIKMKPMP